MTVLVYRQITPLVSSVFDKTAIWDVMGSCTYIPCVSKIVKINRKFDKTVGAESIIFAFWLAFKYFRFDGCRILIGFAALLSFHFGNVIFPVFQTPGDRFPASFRAVFFFYAFSVAHPKKIRKIRVWQKRVCSKFWQWCVTKLRERESRQIICFRVKTMQGFINIHVLHG